MEYLTPAELAAYCRKTPRERAEYRDKIVRETIELGLPNPLITKDEHEAIASIALIETVRVRESGTEEPVTAWHPFHQRQWFVLGPQ